MFEIVTLQHVTKFNSDYGSLLESTPAPPVLTELIYQCLDLHPSVRPNFKVIHQRLKSDKGVAEFIAKNPIYTSAAAASTTSGSINNPTPTTFSSSRSFTSSLFNRRQFPNIFELSNMQQSRDAGGRRDNLSYTSSFFRRQQQGLGQLSPPSRLTTALAEFKKTSANIYGTRFKSMCIGLVVAAVIITLIAILFTHLNSTQPSSQSPTTTTSSFHTNQNIMKTSTTTTATSSSSFAAPPTFTIQEQTATPYTAYSPKATIVAWSGESNKPRVVGGYDDGSLVYIEPGALSGPDKVFHTPSPFSDAAIVAIDARDKYVLYSDGRLLSESSSLVFPTLISSISAATFNSPDELWMFTKGKLYVINSVSPLFTSDSTPSDYAKNVPINATVNSTADWIFPLDHYIFVSINGGQEIIYVLSTSKTNFINSISSLNFTAQFVVPNPHNSAYLFSKYGDLCTLSPPASVNDSSNVLQNCLIAESWNARFPGVVFDVTASPSESGYIFSFCLRKSFKCILGMEVM